MSEKKNRKFSMFWPVLWLGFIGVLLFIPLFFLFISKGGLGPLPDFEELENPQSNLASEIYSVDSVLLGKFYIDNRTNVSYEDLSQNLINALISTEDKRYRKHAGIDLEGTARMLFFMGRKGGGSTITQQLSKLLFTKGSKSRIQRIKQKLQEYVIAIRLERSYTKNEIIAMYLNTFDFINGAVGIKSASKIYFNTTPEDLTESQAATLVGMLKNPSLYNPISRNEKFREYALDRRNVVLFLMKEQSHIDQTQFDTLSVKPLNTKYTKVDHIEGLAPYFRSVLAEYLKEWCTNNLKVDGSQYNIYKDGLKIYTTVHSKMQRYAEEAVKEHLSELQDAFYNQFKRYRYWKPWKEDDGKKVLNLALKNNETYKALKKKGAPKDSIDRVMNRQRKMEVFTWDGKVDTTMSILDSIKHYKMFLQTGFMAMEPSTGYVRAWVGGIDFEHFKYDHVNINTKRQVGSTFKPILYALAVDNGWSPCLKIPNVPVTIYTETGDPWTPKNSDRDGYGGEISLKKCLAKSKNNCAAYIVKNLGPYALAEMAKRMGVMSPLTPVYSLALGSADISLTEMMTVYSTFVNGGVRTTPVFINRIEDKNGNTIQTFPSEQVEVMSEVTAHIMLEMMKGVVNAGGTAASVKFRYNIPGDVAGKTGTTNNHTDGWFMGVTPELMAGAWVGCDDPFLRFRELRYGAGGKMAMPIWAKFFQKSFADKSLGLNKEGTFFEPKQELNIEWDCSLHNQDIDPDIDLNQSIEEDVKEPPKDLDSEFD